MREIVFPRRRQRLPVRSATSLLSQACGLAFRKGIDGTGMLFEFATRARRAIWMMGMRFAIDIIWIDGDTVVDMHKSVRPPRRWISSLLFPWSLPRYRSSKPADKILEVESGWCDRHEIEIGDKVKGQASVSYMLVVAVLAIAIGALLSSDALRDAFTNLYRNMASHVMAP